MYHVVPNHLTVQTAAFPDLKGIFVSISFNARSSLMSLFPDLKGIFESDCPERVTLPGPTFPDLKGIFESEQEVK